MNLPIHFRARVVKGSGRGKDLGAPTINVDLNDVPAELIHGIYACVASYKLQATSYKLNAAMHYGARPVFKDSDSCEVHLLDTVIEETPEILDIQVVAYLRPVRDFDSPALLIKQIADDIAQARVMLAAHERSSHAEKGPS